MAHDDKPYEYNRGPSEQAEASSANRAAGTLQMRILIELQVIAMLLHQQGVAGGYLTDELRSMRRDIAASIT